MLSIATHVCSLWVKLISIHFKDHLRERKPKENLPSPARFFQGVALPNSPLCACAGLTPWFRDSSVGSALDSLYMRDAVFTGSILNKAVWLWRFFFFRRS